MKSVFCLTGLKSAVEVIMINLLPLSILLPILYSSLFVHNAGMCSLVPRLTEPGTRLGTS